MNVRKYKNIVTGEAMKTYEECYVNDKIKKLEKKIKEHFERENYEQIIDDQVINLNEKANGNERKRKLDENESDEDYEPNEKTQVTNSRNTNRKSNAKSKKNRYNKSFTLD